MDFLDIIGKVIEFSEKGEEYSDEVKAFKATLESLQLTVQHVEPRDMPSHLHGMLQDNLAEAKELLNKAGNNNSGWMTNIRNMLPGSHLQKIKEKNQQLVHIITLINLHLNSLKNTKRHLETAYTTDFDADEPAKLKKLHTLPSLASSKSLNMPKKSASESATSYDLYGPTLDNTEDGPDLNGATQADNPDDAMVDDGDFAFRLRIIYDERLGKTLKNCKDFESILEKKWDDKTTVEYIFQRLSFAYLPVEDATRISRDHATLTAIKKEGGNKKADLTVTATVPDAQLFGATIADDGGDENMNENGAGDCGGNEIILKDLSLNGTYFLKQSNLLNFPPGGMKIRGEFKILAKNEETRLEHGDIIGLIMQKPQNKDLIFGFQLLLE